MRGNLAGQLRVQIADSILTCHPYTIVAYREPDLAPRLYPDVLEFKHQRRVALDLFADPLYHDGFRVTRCDHRHGHGVLAARRDRPLAGIGRDPEFSETRNYI